MKARSAGRSFGRTCWRVKHRQLVPQHQQFDVLSEFRLPTPNEQLQNSREREVSEGEQHRPILPSPANAELDTLTATAVLGNAIRRFLLHARALT